MSLTIGRIYVRGTAMQSNKWRGVVISVVHGMNEVTLWRARLVLGFVNRDRLWAGKLIPSPYVTSQLGQLSLTSLLGR